MSKKPSHRQQWFTRADLERQRRPLGRGAFPDSVDGMLETEMGNGWMTVELFEVQDGRRVVSELRILPAPPRRAVERVRMHGERAEGDAVPAGGITPRLLRTIKLGAKHAKPVIADHRRWVREMFGPDALKNLYRPVKRRRQRRRRAKRVDQEYYAELARDYVMLWKRGMNPVAELAKLRGTTPERIRSHVHLARTNGMLSDTTKGKGGGALTPAAEEILARGPRDPR